ncbi:hypothetical protein IAQ61_000326 [Plenodomus lingam]|uniref:uncharacterized protein n=1 Tax=Leptosphaeria maculans TaxID=5022 RepID=UPI00332992A7|nr:hypothetical protein IAQ61_000326 [Plenodomus lingam]
MDMVCWHMLYLTDTNPRTERSQSIPWVPFEKLIEAYGRIGDMMPRIDRLDSALGSDHNFQMASWHNSHNIIVSLLTKKPLRSIFLNATNQSREQALKWERQEEEWRAAKVRVVLSWLATGAQLPEDALDKHAEQCLPNSCDWFVQDDKI